MKIFGIDPGTATTGWAVVEEIKKNARLIACGCVNTSKFHSDEERLVEIGRDIALLIKKYKPDEAAIEDLVFLQKFKNCNYSSSSARGDSL